MTVYASYFLITLAGLAAVPILVLLVEILAAILLSPRERPAAINLDDLGTIAVLVPAHNESSGLLPTILDIKRQLRPCDRLLVVADNCTDDTAEVARAAGAGVTERHEPQKKGKGYALNWGVKQLSNDPPDVLIVIDADCRLADSTIHQLALTSAMTRRPVQALNLMSAPHGSPANSRVAEFAWRVKNLVRPLGLKALGLPCQLMGTGMAFPWRLINSCDVTGRELVEDLKLGFDLTLAGSPPLFCPSASVTSYFPLSAKGTESQRLRWEQGHIGMILSKAPQLISLAIARANFVLLALALDMAVPPLSVLAMLVTLNLLISGLAILVGVSNAAALLSLTNFVVLGCAIFICWLKHGRDILPPGSLLLIGRYMIGKFPIYRQILNFKPRSEWIRTDRGED